MARARITSAAVLLAVLVATGCPSEPDPCIAPSPGLVCPVAGTGALGFNRDGLSPTETDLYLVSAARRGPDGRLYLMDFNNQRLRAIDQGVVETVAGNGFHALAALGEPAIDSPLENPIDFSFLPDGRLVFVSYHDPRVIALDPDGTLVGIAGTGDVGLRGNEGDFGPALDAQFIQLDGIAVTAEGSIYVSDSLAHRVRLIEHGEVRTIAGNGRDEHSGDGGPATEAALQWPTALELAPDGTLFIADTLNHVVRSVSLDGTIATFAGTGTQGFGGDGGSALDASFDQPNGLALADDGTVYIADRGNFRIRRVTPDGVIDTIAGNGIEGLAGDGGPALEAQFGYIARLAFDDDGDLLVADQSNACVRRVILAPR
jgi:sugar lactone lactonase YvrE